MRVKPEQASKVTKRVPTLLPFGKAFPHAPTQLGPSQVCRRAKPDDFPSAALVGAQPHRHSGQRFAPSCATGVVSVLQQTFTTLLVS
jgi:hypothetical protein